MCSRCRFKLFEGLRRQIHFAHITNIFGNLWWDIDLCCRSGNVGTPVVSVDRILLVEIQFEEPVVCNTLEVLVTTRNYSGQSLVVN